MSTIERTGSRRVCGPQRIRPFADRAERIERGRGPVAASTGAGSGYCHRLCGYCHRLCGYRHSVHWEYLAVDGRDFEYPDHLSMAESVALNLTRRGADGWELVAVQDVEDDMSLYLFKRPRS